MAKKKTTTTKKKQPEPREYAPQAELVKSKCPKCQSTRRAPYHNTRTLKLATKKVVWRHTKCLDCGQVRVDKSEESL